MDRARRGPRAGAGRTAADTTAAQPGRRTRIEDIAPAHVGAPEPAAARSHGGAVAARTVSAVPSSGSARPTLQALFGRPRAPSSVDRAAADSAGRPDRRAAQPLDRAAAGLGAGSPLPPALAAALRARSGIDVADVRVHHDSPLPARLGAEAFARGDQIHLGPGAEAHLPHEASHVVQQRQGRVPATSHRGDVAINTDGALEREADDMGSRAAELAAAGGAALLPAAAPPGAGGREPVVQGMFVKLAREKEREKGVEEEEEEEEEEEDARPRWRDDSTGSIYHEVRREQGNVLVLALDTDPRVEVAIDATTGEPRTPGESTGRTMDIAEAGELGDLAGGAGEDWVAHSSGESSSSGDGPHIARRSARPTPAGAASSRRKRGGGRHGGEHKRRRHADEAGPSDGDRAGSFARLTSMTLDELHAFGELHADWHRELDEAQRAEIRQVLGFLRNVDGALAGCGGWHTGEFLRAIGGDAARRARASGYARGVDGRTTCPVRRIQDIEDALIAGSQVCALEEVVGGPARAHQLFGEQTFEDLRARLDHFLRYVRDHKPILSGRDGAEIQSYLHLHAREDPAAFADTLGDWIVNFHHFERRALRRLEQVVADRTGERFGHLPLTVVIHTPLDREGAFHRDAALTELITRPDHATLLIEGQRHLADVSGRLAAIRRDYRDDLGRARRISSVMLAGHGQPRALSIAGEIDDDGRELGRGVDIDQGVDRAFVGRLIGDMAPLDDEARLVFNACHTDSTEVERTPGLSHNGDWRGDIAAIRDHVADHPSLAEYARRYARQRDLQLRVFGANGATRRGVEFVDRRGELTMTAPDDPDLTSPKIVYIATGRDPKGVMRAVLQRWQVRDRALIQTMKTRIAGRGTDFRDALIRALFGRTRDAYWTSARDIARLIDAAGVLKRMCFPADCTIDNLRAARLTRDDTDAVYDQLRDTAEWRDVPFLPIVFHQNRGEHREALAALSRVDAPVRELVRPDRVYIAAEFDYAGCLPRGAEDASREQLLLAIIGFLQHGDRVCREFLNDHVASVADWPADWERAFQRTRGSLLRELGPPEPTRRPPNLQVGDETLRVKPLTRRGYVSSRVASYERPDRASEATPLHIGDELLILGRMDDWYAVEHDGDTRFVPAESVILDEVDGWT